jgi:hypothetical protein
VLGSDRLIVVGVGQQRVIRQEVFERLSR